MSDDMTPEDAVVRLLLHIGENPDREGLLDTPRRVVKALGELTSGYDADVAALLSTTFTESCDEMIVVRRIPFTSLCEHHMLPFSGHVTVGYVPTERVVGLSKIPRVVEAFSRRLQVQERMTEQIAAALVEHLEPQGVGVVVTAHHLCMSMRGVRSSGEMVTSAMRGALMTDPEARAELLDFHRG